VDFTGSGYQPHGSKLYACTPLGKIDDPSGQFLPMGLGDNITLSVTSTNSVTLNFWMNEITASGANNNVVVGSVSAVATVAINLPLTCPAQANYSFWIESSGVTNLAINSGVYHSNAAGEVWCHLAARDVPANDGSMLNARVTSLSIEYKNTAPPAGRAGQFVAQQMPANKHWTEQVNTFQKSMAQGGVEFMEITKGGYIWLKPEAETAFQPMQYSNVNQGSLLNSFYPIFDRNDWLFFWASVPQPGSGALTAQSATITVNRSLEYSTLDVWRETSTPKANMQLFKSSFEHLKGVPQVLTNEFHLSELWNMIKPGITSGLKAVQDYGPTAVQIAGQLAPMLL